MQSEKRVSLGTADYKEMPDGTVYQMTDKGWIKIQESNKRSKIIARLEKKLTKNKNEN